MKCLGAMEETRGFIIIPSVICPEGIDSPML